MKMLLIALLVAIAAFLAYAATLPDHFRWERRIVINAKPEAIFPYVADLRKMGIWSPWHKKDPNMKVTFSGPENGPGSAIEWDGNMEVGKGRQELLEADAPNKAIYKLDFIKPMEGHSMAEFTLTPQGDATEVAWAMHGPQPYLARIIGLLMNCEKMMNREFDKGLADLKALVESGA